MTQREKARQLTLVIALASSSFLWSCTPFALVKEVAHANPGCLYYVNPGRGLVALTIDDGPDSATTPEVLDILQKYDARATFFLIASGIAGNEKLVIRTLREGHEIGNHMSRNEVSAVLSPREFEHSFIAADSVLRRFAIPRWVRPGSGFFNSRMLATFRKHGYTCALGSVYPFDPQIPEPRFATRSILSSVRDGSVIVLHDGRYKGRNTINVLPRLLPELKRRGYSVVTLSELVSPAPTTTPRR